MVSTNSEGRDHSKENVNIHKTISTGQSPCMSRRTQTTTQVCSYLSPSIIVTEPLEQTNERPSLEHFRKKDRTPIGGSRAGSLKRSTGGEIKLTVLVRRKMTTRVFDNYPFSPLSLPTQFLQFPFFFLFLFRVREATSKVEFESESFWKCCQISENPQ
jgi:hypothetical protein